MPPRPAAPLELTDRLRAAAVVAAMGETAACDQLKVAASTLARCIAGLPVRSITRLASST